MSNRPRTGASRPGTQRGRLATAGTRPGTHAAPKSRVLGGLPPRPNTSASVRGDEVLHLPNQWALPSVKNLDDKDFLLDMVKQNGDYLQYASTQMRRDPDVVLAAVKNKGFAMKYAGPELVEDAAFIMKVVQECSIGYKYAGVNGYQFTPLEYAQSNVRKNKAVVREAVVRQSFALCFADVDLRDDTEFVMELVEKNGLALQYASKRLKMNMMIVEAAVKQNPNALVFASPEIRNDPGLLKIQGMHEARIGSIGKPLSRTVSKDLSRTGSSRSKR